MRRGNLSAKKGYFHLLSSSATANNVVEAGTLVEQNFDYATDVDEMKLFRKRK
jgi:hypothetical protein